MSSAPKSAQRGFLAQPHRRTFSNHLALAAVLLVTLSTWTDGGPALADDGALLIAASTRVLSIEQPWLRVQARLLLGRGFDAAAIEPPFVLRSDDGFRIELQATDPLYLGIIYRTNPPAGAASYRHLRRDYPERDGEPDTGERVEWRLLYPLHGAGSGAPRLPASEKLVVPGNGLFRLDQQIGRETVEILLARGDLGLDRIFDRRSGLIHRQIGGSAPDRNLRARLEDLLAKGRRNTRMLATLDAEAKDLELPMVLRIEIVHRP